MNNQTADVMKEVIEKERPDFIAITGDIVSG